MIKTLLKLGTLVAGAGLALNFVKQHEERMKEEDAKKNDSLPDLPKHDPKEEH